MKCKCKAWLMLFPFVIVFLVTTSIGIVQATDSFITNGMSILAYGEKQAFLVSNDKRIYSWDSVALKWQLYAIMTPDIRQLDALSDGSRIIATDKNNKVYNWNKVFGFGSAWDNVRNGYEWVLHDPVTKTIRGKRADWKAVWEEWDKPEPQGGDTWNKFLPAGGEGEQKMKQFCFIDNDRKRSHRWERGDVGYSVALNQSGATTPFHIFYFGDEKNVALDRITDPPFPTHNIEDVFVKQISYDELYQNLWSVDKDGVPWRWDNVRQEWIKSDILGDEGFQPEPPPNPVVELLKEQNDFYIRTTYIDGDYTPVIIIFKDTMILHFVLGERSKADFHDARFVIFEKRKPNHKFHTTTLLPKDTPQKIVRIDGGKRIRENHYLERLLIANNIIADDKAIGVYPWRHQIIRR